MHTLQTEQSGVITTVRLIRGRANAINGELVRELHETFLGLRNDPGTRGVLLTGHGDFFSAGLDVVELYDYNETELLNFWRAFSELIKTLVSFPKPLVCAVTGHSPAGGCVLTLCCDYRVMAEEGKYTIGLNEIQVGVVVPEMIFDLYRFWLGSRKAYQYLLEAKLMPATEAKEAGLVDDFCPLNEVETRALGKLNGLLTYNSDVWQLSKINLRRRLTEQLNVDFLTAFEPTLKQWWTPESRAILGQIVARLKK